MKKLTCILGAMLLSLSTFARTPQAPRIMPDLAQDPARTMWEVFISPNFEVIFPREMESTARRVTGLLEHLRNPVAEGLAADSHKLSVVLHPYVLQSNGFAALAPRRSEWFMTPWMGPDVTQTDWASALAVHEYRHIAQFDSSRVGFAKYLSWFLGENGLALANGIALPAWYFEGDAVTIETALSHAGRGRMPQFNRDLRALLLEDREFTYDQLHLGSYTTHYPNHYVYGYLLLGYLRLKSGKDAFLYAQREAASGSWNPFAFLNAIERQTGMSFNDFYAEAMAYYKKLWQSQLSLDPVIESPMLVHKDVKPWTNYDYPQETDHGLLTLKNGQGHIPEYVLTNKKGNEEHVFYPAPLVQGRPFRVRNNLIPLAETVLDPRWGLADYAKLTIREVHTGNMVWERSKTRWMIPSLSPQATRLAAVYWSPAQFAQVIALDWKKDQVLGRLTLPESMVVLGMDWVNEDEILLLLREGTYQQTLRRWKITEKSPTAAIIQSEVSNWAYPAVEGEWIYLQSQRSGRDQIHRIHLTSGVEEIVTAEKYGAYWPAPSKSGLTFASYHPNGMQNRRFSWEQLPKRAIPQTPANPIVETLVKQEGKGELLSSAREWKGKKERYLRREHMWNAHSWFLLAPPLSPFISASLQSRDILNSFSTSFGTDYNVNEQALGGFAIARWSYWWPMFDLGMDFRSRRQEYTISGQEIEDRWEEGAVELGMTLPWQHVSGRWLTQMSLRPFASAIKATGLDVMAMGELGNTSLFAGGAELNATVRSRMSDRDWQPSWGLEFHGLAQNAQDIQGRGQEAKQGSAQLLAYLPGVSSHHGFMLEASHETQERYGYHFVSRILSPRGHKNRFAEDFNKYSVNYLLPLGYPEWTWGRWVYWKRIGLNVFYDGLIGKRYRRDFEQRSYGAEFLMEHHFFRHSLPITWGLRFSQPVEDDEDESLEAFLRVPVMSF